MAVRLPPFDKDLSCAGTLPAPAYFDPEIQAAERERIFSRTWQPVGNVADVTSEGAYFTCEVAGEPLVVLRDTNGELRAFFNVCRHRAGPVAEGKGSRRSLTCRYHGWTYGLDGALKAAPETEGVRNFDKACFGLVPVRVESWGPFVFVSLDDDAAPLSATLGELAAECASLDLGAYRPIARRDYVVRCNWKVYVDNYLEGYHLPIVHPRLFEELEYGKYRVDTRRFHSRQIAPFRPPRADKTERRKYVEADGEALYYWVFPNWVINVYPDNMSINIVLPTAVDETLTIFEWFVKNPDGPFAREAIEPTIAFSHEIQIEDIAICEAVQKGLRSRAYAGGGRFSVTRENGVHHFQSLVHEYLTGHPSFA
jgi:choline monooxygenase